ncbi:hypothetical protein AN958_09620 [Leucoagaricus sp. SymC.cos]|nr:hypothetical protein AN958_09620 [Leucoagaricus sp. SymC.cos]
MTHARPCRLLQEDEGVRGPLWIWSNPDVGALHIVANVFRIIIALLTAPAWMWLSPTIGATLKYPLQAIAWGHEWSQIPEAVLLPDNKGKVGEYAVAGWEPRWLLEVQFQGVEIIKKTQVHYGHVKKRIQDAVYCHWLSDQKRRPTPKGIRRPFGPAI